MEQGRKVFREKEEIQKQETRKNTKYEKTKKRKKSRELTNPLGLDLEMKSASRIQTNGLI